ncbi:nucleoside-diphosphate sugar epimerase [Lysobacteraceae bacterium NML120232]|nr:nucleoside-diphosphate sugar epimerase [Xanthomonadaceae bacterium NML08-0793]PJK12728.1 nucleoside-diphosphate sugar epimerase [Xanthomonadaceae bacterium NML120232]
MSRHSSSLQQSVAPPLLLLSDGHAGNRRQAEALARALGHADAPHLTVTATACARLFAPRVLPGARRALGAPFQHVLQHPPAQVIGCGRQAALATRLLRMCGSFAVQILDPRLNPRHWDVVIAPRHDGLTAANVISMDGSLHAVDAASLAAARQDFAALTNLPGPRVALLLGGASKHWPIAEKTLFAALHQLAQRVAAQQGSLLISASRRTPDAWRQYLPRLQPALLWRDAQDGRNPYPGLLALADVIVCSADSVNMLSEAAATCAPLYVIGSEYLHGRPAQFVHHLQAQGRIRNFVGTLEHFEVSPLRETARVAEQLKKMMATHI